MWYHKLLKGICDLRKVWQSTALSASQSICSWTTSFLGTWSRCSVVPNLHHLLCLAGAVSATCQSLML